MRLELSQDQELVRDTTAKFLAERVPLTEVRRLADEPAGFERGWWKTGAELGWTAMLISEEHGGGSLTGEGLLDLALVAEEMGRLVSPGPLLPVNVVADGVDRRGTDAQRGAVLPGLAGGELVAAWCPSFPWSGAAPTVSRGEGGFVIDGLATQVEAGAEADHLLVSGRLDGALTQFLIPGSTPGIAAAPLKGLDMVRRFADVRFDRVAVPDAAVLGEVGGAESAQERQLQVAIALQSAETCGALERVFAFTVEYAFDRFSFGRPLASYQALKHRFADMKMWLEACHATATAAADAVQAEAADAAELVSVTKAYIADRAPEIVQDCVQMHGGIGVTWEHDIHLYLRRVTTNAVMHGTVADHRERIAALLSA